MSLTVVKRPQGYVLDTTQVTISSVAASGTDALFTKIAHGLVTGDFIYVYSNLSSYNGYWYVSKISNDTFKILEYATATPQAYINGTGGTFTMTYYKSVLTHGWNCIHLPIVYKIKSDIWPTNGTDTARTITTFSNYNGYTYINASGDIKTTGTASALEEVVLSGTSVDGIYKIINWFSDTNFVINLPYSAGNVLSSGTVQYYYYNYCAKIKIFAGLTAANHWQAQKPYVQMTELKLIPDSNGIITLNIAEHIKSKVTVVGNNSIADTLPVNLDAFCMFYISVAESYDDSNMYTVSEFTSAYTSDQGTFEGYAVNAKLPFKSRPSGALSDYVPGLTAATRQKFLTPFTRPTLFPGKYFDLSFIKNDTSSNLYARRQVYKNGVLLAEFFEYTYLPSDSGNASQGIYRYSFAQSGFAEDRIDLTLFSGTIQTGTQISETKTIDVSTACSSQDFYMVWMNYLGGYDYWNFLAWKEYFIDSLESKTQETNVFNTWPKSYGEFADSITRQTLRRAKNRISVRSQFLTSDQEDAIKLIVASPLAQICTSQYDRRTLIIDANSIRIRKDHDKTRTLTLDVVYTDELASQSL